MKFLIFVLGLGDPLILFLPFMGLARGYLDAIVENLQNEDEDENPDVIKFSLDWSSKCRQI